MKLGVALGWHVHPWEELLSLVRLAAVSLVILLPCVLMGGTLPLFCRQLVRRHDGVSQGVGRLYALNTLGAAVKRILQPRAVLPVRMGRRAIQDEVVTHVTTFLLLFLALFAAGGMLLGMTGLDLITAFSASATCLGNIGPGFGELGPTHTMSGLSTSAKIILMSLMMALG